MNRPHEPLWRFFETITGDACLPLAAVGAGILLASAALTLVDAAVRYL